MPRQSGGSAARQRGECFVTALRRRRGCDNTAAPRFGKHCTKSIPWRGRGNTETCAANRCCIFSPWGRLSGPLLPDTHPPPKGRASLPVPLSGRHPPSSEAGARPPRHRICLFTASNHRQPFGFLRELPGPPAPPTHPPPKAGRVCLAPCNTHPPRAGKLHQTEKTRHLSGDSRGIAAGLRQKKRRLTGSSPRWPCGSRGHLP